MEIFTWICIWLFVSALAGVLAGMFIRGGNNDKD